MVSAAVLAGTVRSRDGDRIEHGHVCAVDSESSAIGKPKTTCVDADVDGRYELSLAATGAYSVDAEAPGFRPGSALGGRLISVAWGQRRTGLDIVLEHGGARVAGQVLDLTGGPIAGALIRATRFVTPRSTVATESDRDGKFVLWTLPGHIGLNAEAVGYAPSRVASRVAPTGDVVIRLTPGSSVQGHVVSGVDLKPVSGVEVRAAGLRMPSTPLNRSAVSDSDGAFEISGLQPGEYTLVAEGVGWRGGSHGSFKIGLLQALNDVTVTVSPAPLVSGTVVLQSDNSPCQMGTVNLGPTGIPSSDDPPSATDEVDGAHRSQVPSILTMIEASGEAHFRAVPPGTYRATVRCADHVLVEGPTIVEVGQVSVEGLLWKVSAGVGLLVNMVDEQGSPLPGAVVSLQSLTRHLNTQLTGDDRGQYDYPAALYPGVYTLAPRDGYTGDPVEVELRAGMGKLPVTVRFKGKGSILVTVQGANAEPIDDVSVRATVVGASAPPAVGATGPTPSQEVADEPIETPQPPRQKRYVGVALGDGRFRIGPIEPGTYSVQASDGVNPPWDAGGGFAQVAHGIVNASIVLKRDGRIRGVVVDASSQPMPDTWVGATCEGDSSPGHPTKTFRGSGRQSAAARVMTDKEGRFEIGGLERTAVCTVRAEQPFGLAGEKIDVTPGDDVRVAINPVEQIGGRASLDNGIGRAAGEPANMPHP